jgi:hypothetical protein
MPNSVFRKLMKENGLRITDNGQQSISPLAGRIKRPATAGLF